MEAEGEEELVRSTFLSLIFSSVCDEVRRCFELRSASSSPSSCSRRFKVVAAERKEEGRCETIVVEAREGEVVSRERS